MIFNNSNNNNNNNNNNGSDIDSNNNNDDDDDDAGDSIKTGERVPSYRNVYKIRDFLTRFSGIHTDSSYDDLVVG